jgi:hypothetical protein
MIKLLLLCLQPHTIPSLVVHVFGAPSLSLNTRRSGYSRTGRTAPTRILFTTLPRALSVVCFYCCTGIDNVNTLRLSLTTHVLIACQCWEDVAPSMAVSNDGEGLCGDYPAHWQIDDSAGASRYASAILLNSALSISIPHLVTFHPRRSSQLSLACIRWKVFASNSHPRLLALLKVPDVHLHRHALSSPLSPHSSSKVLANTWRSSSAKLMLIFFSSEVWT